MYQVLLQVSLPTAVQHKQRVLPRVFRELNLTARIYLVLRDASTSGTHHEHDGDLESTALGHVLNNSHRSVPFPEKAHRQDLGDARVFLVALKPPITRPNGYHLRKNQPTKARHVNLTHFNLNSTKMFIFTISLSFLGLNKTRKPEQPVLTACGGGGTLGYERGRRKPQQVGLNTTFHFMRRL